MGSLENPVIFAPLLLTVPGPFSWIVKIRLQNEFSNKEFKKQQKVSMPLISKPEPSLVITSDKSPTCNVLATNVCGQRQAAAEIYLMMVCGKLNTPSWVMDVSPPASTPRPLLQHYSSNIEPQIQMNAQARGSISILQVFCSVPFISKALLSSSWHLQNPVWCWLGYNCGIIFLPSCSPFAESIT